MTRLLRNKKILKEANRKARRKIEYLSSEVDLLEDPGFIDYSASDVLMGISPAIWSFLSILNDFSNVGDTVVEISSSF